MADGQGPDLYDPAVQAGVQKQILGGRTFEAGLNPFNNPPHLVVPFVLLAWLPLDLSYLVWAAVATRPPRSGCCGGCGPSSPRAGPATSVS